MQTETVQEGPPVLREDRDGVAILRLNRPKALNALSRAIVEALETELKSLENAPDIHSVILTGVGEKAFCAGADIAGMASLTPQEAEAWGRRGQALSLLIEHHSKPVLAAVNGYALGGGLELAMACDWILAVPGARLGQPEVTIGVIPGFGGTQRLARLAGRHAAKWLCMTGEAITAEDAYRLGVVTHLVPKEKLLDESLRLLGKVRENAPIAVRLAKEVINRGSHLPLETALELELHAFALTFATRDQKEGMQAFVEKRKPRYTGQ